MRDDSSQGRDDDTDPTAANPVATAAGTATQSTHQEDGKNENKHESDRHDLSLIVLANLNKAKLFLLYDNATLVYGDFEAFGFLTLHIVHITQDPAADREYSDDEEE
ncbi:MAG TPA: hypothetical protein VFR34_14930 [Paracoccaceae bacterium]|nr:hypothetical protein [Paracoccaceae bacterium]